MIYRWIWFVIFGILIIMFPQLLAYLIAFFFIFIWVNIIVFALAIKKATKNEQMVFQIGSFKILKK